MQIHSGPITSSHETVLPGIAKAASWGVWIRPTNSAFRTEDAQILLQAFGDFGCILWHTSEGGARSRRMKDHLRSLGTWPPLSKNVIAQWTLEHFSIPRTVYGDICWVSFEAAGSLGALLSRSTSGSDSTLSFIPEDDLSAQQWISGVYGLQWLWLLGSQTTTRSINADVVLLSYIEITKRIKGVAGLVFDIQGTSGLAFLSERIHLEAGADKIGQRCELVSEQTFKTWYRDGLHFRASP